MSGGRPKPPPPIISRSNIADTGVKGAEEQLVVLCEFMMKEFLYNSPDEITTAFDAYGNNVRDLYDNIIQSISDNPDHMKTQRPFTRINNIFNEYAGINLENRAFDAPPGVKVFKAIGEISADGNYRAYPSLFCRRKPHQRLRSPSPKRTVSFPPGIHPNGKRGMISPSSPQPVPLNWPPAQKTEGKGSRGNKIPSGTKDVRIADASVRPPGARSPSYSAVASGSGLTPAGRGRVLPQVNLPGQGGPALATTMVVNINVPDIKLAISRPGPRDAAWPPSRVEEASRAITAYLRHGSGDTRYNIQGTDGYIRVALFVQLPMISKAGIDQHVIGLVLKSPNPRIVIDDSGTRIRAIQGHSMARYNIAELYTEITSPEWFRSDPIWAGRVPDHLVIEISKEVHLTQWARIRTYAPSMNNKYHTMKAVCGTGRQEHGAKNVTLYAFISIELLFKHIPKIEIYMTGNGRIVTNRNIPAPLVVMVRRNDAGAIVINDAMWVPDPPAPAGPPRVRSRDSQGSSPAPRASNYHDLPLPDGKTVTKAGLELKTGHMNMPCHLVQGTARNQNRELQMARGVFKSSLCRHGTSGFGCRAGAMCVFRHRNDDDMAIAAEVRAVRLRIYTELYNDGFTLPPEILYEIGKITLGQLNAALDARARHKERLEEQALPRPRMHDNSRSPRSPRSSPRESVTPPPRRAPEINWAPENYDELVRLNMGKGKGDSPATMDVDSGARMRDHTTGGDDEEASDHEVEAVAPIANNNMNINPPRSLTSGGREVITEPIQQLPDESGDAVMGDEAPTVEA